MTKCLVPWIKVYKKSGRSSDGHFVNVGNADANGANVNRNQPDNRNDNLGVSLSRSV